MKIGKLAAIVVAMTCVAAASAACWLSAGFQIAAITAAAKSPVKKFTASTHKVFVPSLGKFVHFHDRKAMKVGHPTKKFHLHAALLPSVTLPIDYGVFQGKQLPFPLYGNDRLGDCMYVAGIHCDQTWTGAGGVESVFDENTLEQDYLQLSGGDNGLDEGTLIPAWKSGLAGNKSASILGALDIDPNNPQLMQVACQYFGCVFFMLDVPDDWIQNFTDGGVWDAPAVADQNNGHGVMLNGVDKAGRYNVRTWGQKTWLTPAGVKQCDPTAFVAFSMRWFNAQGYAPNGLHYVDLSKLWVTMGGNALPANPFPAPAPVVNPPTPVVDPPVVQPPVIQPPVVQPPVPPAAVTGSLVIDVPAELVVRSGFGKMTAKAVPFSGIIAFTDGSQVTFSGTFPDAPVLRQGLQWIVQPVTARGTATITK